MWLEIKKERKNMIHTKIVRVGRIPGIGSRPRM